VETNQQNSKDINIGFIVGVCVAGCVLILVVVLVLLFVGVIPSKNPKIQAIQARFIRTKP
jgi:hypothetical protein